MNQRGWAKVEIRDLGKVYSGGTPSTDNADFWNGSINWCTPTDITSLENRFLGETTRKLSHDGLRNSSATILPKGSVVVCTRATIGACAITSVEMTTNQGFKSIVPNKRITADFLYYLLCHIKPQLLRLASGSTFLEVSKTDFEKVKVDLPPLPEQRVIASILSTWDSAIELTKIIIAAKVKRKRGLMQQLLTGKKRFREFEGQERQRVRISDLFEEVWRYEKWDENALYNLVSIRRRGGGLFSRGALLGQQIKVKKLKSLRTGDFLISKRQVVHGAWGLVTPEYDGTMVSDEYDSLVVKNPDQLSVEFFTHLSRLPLLRRMAALACNGVHIEKLIFDWDDFSKNFISIPSSVEEQRRISEILDSCDKEVELLKQQLDALKRQKRGLMQKLLTGQIRVKVDDMEATAIEAGS